MKALKVLISIFLGFIMFVLVGVFGVLTAGRILLSGNNISNMVKDMAKESGDFNIGKIVDNNASISSEELDDAVSEMKEYGIDVDKVYDEFGDFASQVLRYSIGMTDDIDAESLKEVLKDAAEKYEDKTGEKIDLDEIDEGIDEGVKEMKREIRESKKDNKQAFEIMETVFNTKTYFGILIGIIVCAVLMILINKSAGPLCVSFIVISILGIIGNIGFFVITKLVPVDGGDKVMELVLNNLSHIFLGIAIAFLIILVISIIGVIISSKKKPKEITT